MRFDPSSSPPPKDTAIAAQKDARIATKKHDHTPLPATLGLLLDIERVKGVDARLGLTRDQVRTRMLGQTKQTIIDELHGVRHRLELRGLVALEGGRELWLDDADAAKWATTLLCVIGTIRCLA